MSLFRRWMLWAGRGNWLAVAIHTPLISVPMLSILGIAPLCTWTFLSRRLAVLLGFSIGATLSVIVGFWGDWIPFCSLVVAIATTLTLRTTRSWNVAVMAALLVSLALVFVLDLFSSLTLSSLKDTILTSLETLPPIYAQSSERIHLDSLLPEVIGFGGAALGLACAMLGRYIQALIQQPGAFAREIHSSRWRIRDSVNLVIIFVLAAIVTERIAVLFLLLGTLVSASCLVHHLVAHRSIWRRTFLIWLWYSSIFVVIVFSLAVPVIAWVAVAGTGSLLALDSIRDLRGRQLEREVRLDHEKRTKNEQNQTKSPTEEGG